MVRMRTARWAAFLALSIPTQATGTPLGTCAVASSASSPFRGPTANGTPITGRSVSEAAKPGRAAESPAPAMTTRKPLLRAFFTSSAVRSGSRWAEETWSSYETPALLSTSKAGSILGLSLSEPTRISTSGTPPVSLPSSPFPSCGLVDHGVVLAALARHVARVGDEALHFGEGHAPGRARGRDDILLHHQRAEVVGAEPERDLADLRAHRHPGGLDVGYVVEHDARDRLGAEVGHGVGLLEVGELGVLGLQRPANERGEAPGASLDLPHAEQVLDPVGQRFAQAVHHRHRGLESQPMGRLHDLEPAVGARFLFGDAVANLLDENLPAPQRLQLVDLATDLLEREHVAFAVLRPPVEGAEFAIRDADVRVVDVPVDDVGDHVLRMQPPACLVGEAPQLEQRRPLVQLDVRPELAAGAVDHGHATWRNWSDPSGTRPRAASRRRKSVSPARCVSVNA